MPRNYRRSPRSNDPIGRFFKRPAVQLSILGIAIIAAIVIVLWGQP